VIGGLLDWMTLEVFSNLGDSVILNIMGICYPDPFLFWLWKPPTLWGVQRMLRGALVQHTPAPGGFVQSDAAQFTGFLCNFSRAS